MLVFLLLLEQLSGNKRRDTRWHLTSRDVRSPGIHPADERFVGDFRVCVVCEGNNLGATFKGECTRIEHLGGVSAMATCNNKAMLTQTLRCGDAELSCRIST